MVLTPPPTVETTMRPMELVVVMASPAVRELDDGDDVSVGLPALLELPASAADEVRDSSELVLGDEVTTGEFSAGALLDSLPAGEADIEDSGPCGTGVTRVDAGSGEEESVVLPA